jgi:probable F420-dependent oxidoreductase
MVWAMKYGIIAFATDQSTTPAESAQLAEEQGFESIWFPEHSHLPQASGGWPGGERIPDAYARTIDQWVALGMATAATSTIRLGTGMCLVPQHDPVWLAKMAASVDHLSEGRLTMGIGYVWNRAELADHGIDFASRRARTRECVELMRALWTDDIASYQGQHVRLSPSQAWPKPARAGGPPIVIGAGVGPRTLADLVDWADGWAPMFGRDDIEGTLIEVRGALAAAGRDVDRFEISVFGVPPDPEAIAQVREWGVHRMVFGAGGADVDRFGAALQAIRQAVDA